MFIGIAEIRFFFFFFIFFGGEGFLLFIYLCQRMVPALHVQVLYTVCSCITLKELYECFLFGMRLQLVGQ